MYLTDEVIEGADVLTSITAKGLDKVIFLSTGAEAIEFALRHAKMYKNKDGIAALTRGYHGLTLATQGITGGGIYARPKVPQNYYLPIPDSLDYKDCLARSGQALLKAKGRLAAIIVEPIISVGGMIYPPKAYFQGLQALAKEHDALLIFDECQTGLGRTGTWFGYEYCGVVPDILVLAKGMGMGLPVSAVVMKNGIASTLEGKIQHFSSHQNEPFAGLTTKFLIKSVQKKKLLQKVNASGKYILDGLHSLSLKYPDLLEHPRGRGLMIAFDIPSKLFTPSCNPGQTLISLLEDQGVLIQAVRRGQTFRILPAYTIDKKDIHFFLDRLDVSLGKLRNII